MKVKIPFNRIHVNQSVEGLEVIFDYNGEWYQLDWNRVPEKFKILYVAMLKLQGLEIPEHLKEYERDTIDISDINIEIELDECEKIPETYPL